MWNVSVVMLFLYKNIDFYISFKYANISIINYSRDWCQCPNTQISIYIQTNEMKAVLFYHIYLG